MTVQELIDRALMSIGYLAKGESADATDSADAMEELNFMMQGWNEGGMNFNWFNQDTLGDTVPLPDWVMPAVILKLAIRMGAVFQVPAPPAVYDQAAVALKLARRVYANLKIKNADMSHLHPGSGHHRYDITRDEL